MKKEVKIILFPEEHKSKNGTFFENLMRIIFEKEGYELNQNINFTGLEIDLFGKHKRREETLLVECKAKQKVQSTEIKNFVCNLLVLEKANYGYFVHTEELDHQASGLKIELLDGKCKGKATFLGPKEIIDILIEVSKVKPYSELSLIKDNSLQVYNLILAYTYFRVFYVLIASKNTAIKNYYLYDATTLQEIQDINIIADEENSQSITIEQALKSSISDIKELTHKVYTNISVSDENSTELPIEISENFLAILDDMGVSFIHSKVDEIKLSDIFIAPNLIEISAKSKMSKQKDIRSLWTIFDNYREKEEIKIVIIGNEISGKTSVCKQLFIKSYDYGFVPILLNGEKIKNSRLDAFNIYVKSSFNEQYCQYDFEKIAKEKIILIIDDFHKFKKSAHKNNEDCRDILVGNISKEYKNIICTADTFMPLEVITKNKSVKYVFDNFGLCRILEFGSKLRHNLVEKWHNLGCDINFCDTNDTFKKYDEVERQIESIIGKNYIPSYPFYILTLLQAAENGLNRNQNYSLHGFYYEHLINQQLDKAVRDKQDISLYYNYITELCFHLFESKINTIKFKQFENFHNDYCKKYKTNNLRYDNILSNLSSAKLLDIVDKDILKIHYKYVYYFFVAKYLTNNISNTEIREIISKMSQRVYKDEYAGIIMFLTHLSKDPYIINEILNNAKEIFKGTPIAQINHDMDDINQLIREIPKQVVELSNVNDIREEQLQEKEEIENLQNSDETATEDESLNLDENISNLNFMAQFTLALKTIDILGQLAKKYWGEMTGEQKYDIVSETYFLGLRTIKYYLNLVHEHKDLIAELLKNLIKSKHIKNNFSIEDNIENTTSEYIFRLCFLSSFGIIKRLTHAIGYEKLSNIFNEVLEEHPINSIRLINLSIKLDCFQIEKIPMDDIRPLKADLEKNILGTLVLRNLVIDYMYMFNTEYDERQKIAELFKIDIKDQRNINLLSQIKKE